jgi:hypothetical protein
MASTSSLPLLHVWTKCDVFLSFRGTNTRKSLTSLIFTTLCVKTKLMLASLINLMEEIDRACPLGNDWRVIYFDRHFLRKLCRFYTFSVWGNSPRLLSAWRTNDRWFYLFSTKLFQAMFKIWLGAMEMHFASMKDNAHVMMKFLWF